MTCDFRMPPKRTSSRGKSSPPPKRPRRSRNSGPLEDEVFEDEPKEEPEKESEEEESNSSSSSDGEEGSSSESDFEFESLAKSRSRRAVAGNRMQQLLDEQRLKMKSSLPMTDEDKEAYKDFVEVRFVDSFEPYVVSCFRSMMTKISKQTTI